MKRWIQVRSSQYGGWMLGCDRCPAAWDYDDWPDAIRAAQTHARWHVARRRTMP